jgi:DNA polymerase III subunit beta
VRITVNAGELASALALAASLSDSKAKKIAALEAVHLKAADGAVRISANVLDHALALKVSAEVGAQGELAVSGSRIAALAAGFPSTAPVEIQDDGPVARVDCGRSRFKLPTVAPDDLPPMPRLTTEEIGRVELAREEAHALFDRPAFAMSTAQARYYFCGILLHDTDNAALAAAASDGFRFARVVIPGAAGLSQDHNLIVPAPAVKIISKILGDKSVERMTLRRAKALFALETAKAAFVSKVIDGTFPDYSKFVPKPSGNNVTADRAELAQALARVTAVSEERERRVVAGLRWSSGEPVLRLCSVGTDAANDVVAAEVTGSCAVALQAGLLAELLDALDGERVCLDARDGSSPILVTDPDDVAFLALQMPCTWQQATKTK